MLACEGSDCREPWRGANVIHFGTIFRAATGQSQSLSTGDATLDTLDVDHCGEIREALD